MLAVTWTALGVLAAVSLGFMAMVKWEIGGLRTDMGTEIGGLRTEIGGLRTEIGGLRTDMGTEIGGLRTEIGGLRTEMQSEIGGLRTEIGGLRTEMRTEIGGLRTEMHIGFNALGNRLDRRIDQLNGKFDVMRRDMDRLSTPGTSAS